MERGSGCVGEEHSEIQIYLLLFVVYQQKHREEKRRAHVVQFVHIMLHKRTVFLELLSLLQDNS